MAVIEPPDATDGADIIIIARHNAVTWSDILSITTPRSRALSTMLTVDDSTGTLLMLILSIWFLCSSHITCVLDELRRSRLELVHAPTSATHPARRSIASAASSTDDVTQTWQSSAYWCSRRPWLAMTLFKSAVYKTKRRGRGRSPVELRTVYWTNGRWTTADRCIGNLLRPAGNERRHPA